MRKMFFLTFVFCLYSAICSAESCTAMPGCEELGYYKGTNVACGDDASRYIYCPYDSEYRKCINYDCAKMGFKKNARAEFQTWCSDIVACVFDSTYVLCADAAH